MTEETLALIELANSEDIRADLGPASQELFLSEFRERVGQLKRGQDRVNQLLPHKMCVWLRGVSDASHVRLAAAKLQRLFDEPIRVVDEEIKAHFRAAFVPPSSWSMEQADRLMLAEKGLREARIKNVPFIIKDAPSPTELKEDPIAVRDVGEAIERGEFALYFQQKVHATYRNIVGAEALMRWHHPKRGVLPPAAFLSSVKQGGLLEKLTWFAIKAAIAQCRRWPDEVHVAVNIPPAVLLSEQLESVLRDALAIFSLQPRRVTLEVTEDAVIADPARAQETLEALRGVGVRLAIDDFGTGYSSLAYLRELPVDELKIDRAFVQDIRSDPKNRGIVKAVVELAHGLGLKVVAEGVEDAATAECLQQMGCDLLQGYWFGKPVPHEKFLSDLNRR